MNELRVYIDKEYSITSNPLNLILEKDTSVAEDGTQRRTVQGYYSSLEGVFNGYVEKSIKQIKGDSFEDILKETQVIREIIQTLCIDKKIKEDIKKIIEEAGLK